MVILLSMMVLIYIHTNQYFRCYKLSGSGVPGSTTHNKINRIPKTKTENKYTLAHNIMKIWSYQNIREIWRILHYTVPRLGVQTQKSTRMMQWCTSGWLKDIPWGRGWFHIIPDLFCVHVFGKIRSKPPSCRRSPRPKPSHPVTYSSHASAIQQQYCHLQALGNK